VLRMRWARAVTKGDAEEVTAAGQPSEPGPRAGFGTYHAA